MSDWRTRDIVKLIALYRQNECLWNYHSIGYKSKDLRQKAWQHLAMKFGKDVVDLKKKIKYLRSTYVTEKKKVDDTKRSGASAEMIYQPTLYYYDDLKFLEPYVVLRKNTFHTTEAETLADYSGADNTINRVQESADERTNQFERDSVHIRSPTPKAENRTPSPCELSATSSGSLHEYRRNGTKEELSEAPNYNTCRVQDPLSTSVNFSQESPTENLYASFGHTLSLQLRQLRPLEATATMSEIHQLVTKKLLQSMQRRTVAARNAKAAKLYQLRRS